MTTILQYLSDQKKLLAITHCLPQLNDDRMTQNPGTNKIPTDFIFSTIYYVSKLHTVPNRHRNFAIDINFDKIVKLEYVEITQINVVVVCSGAIVVVM